MTMQTIQVNGKEIKYTLRQGNSSQYVTLKFLSEDELEIILPKKHTVDIEALLKKKTALIQRKHSEYMQASTQKDKIMLFGKFYDTEISNKGVKYNISLEDETVRVNLPESAGTKNLAYEYLKKWIKRRLLKILNDYLSTYESEMKAPISKVYVKNQKARWASYSPKRNINFNIKLAALPKKVIEYVVIHELAHTIEPRHNKKFWYIVEKFCPDYRERKQELIRHLFVIDKNRIWQKMLKNQALTSSKQPKSLK